MQQIVINRCFGGFSLSEEALALYMERSGEKDVMPWDIHRDDFDLVSVVRDLGEKAHGLKRGTDLKIVSIPNDVSWYISDYDGLEEIHEVHRTWY